MRPGPHNTMLRWAGFRRRISRRGLLAASIALLSLFWFGCTPETRYQTLSFFFDGVPDPRAVSEIKTASNAEKLNPNRAPLSHQHQPFEQGHCEACHEPDRKRINVAHVKDACLSCHPVVEKQYAVMHEPVVTGDCMWCHSPHESNEPSLLIASSAALCLQCHNRNTLDTKTAAHVDPQDNCLSCHSAHGGSDAQLLKTIAPPQTRPSQGGSS